MGKFDFKKVGIDGVLERREFVCINVVLYFGNDLFIIMFRVFGDKEKVRE